MRLITTKQKQVIPKSEIERKVEAKKQNISKSSKRTSRKYPILMTGWRVDDTKGKSKATAT